MRALILVANAVLAVAAYQTRASANNTMNVDESLAPGSKPSVETTKIGSIAKQREPDQRPNIGNYPTKPVE